MEGICSYYNIKQKCHEAETWKWVIRKIHQWCYCWMCKGYMNDEHECKFSKCLLFRLCFLIQSSRCQEKALVWLRTFSISWQDIYLFMNINIFITDRSISKIILFLMSPIMRWVLFIQLLNIILYIFWNLVLCMSVGNKFW